MSQSKTQLFIGLIHMPIDRLGQRFPSTLHTSLCWEFLACPLENSVLGRGTNIQVGPEGDSMCWRDHRVKRQREIRTLQSPWLDRIAGVRRGGHCSSSYCALRAISISRMLSSASLTLRSR